MAKYRNRLPQLSDSLFLTDGGIETSLIYLDGFDLPMFAAFDLFKTENGLKGLRDYFVRYTSIAKAHGLGFVLESPTWRANPDWANALGYSAAQLTRINRKAIDLMVDLRKEFETDRSPMVISGCFGPRGDGYDPGKMMTAEEAAEYHAFQAEIFADSEADMVTAITMNYVKEAIGITKAAGSSARRACSLASSSRSAAAFSAKCNRTANTARVMMKKNSKPDMRSLTDAR
jgi:S-methylmethionine-dependent homocysteine/selenocysteine methylase